MQLKVICTNRIFIYFPPRGSATPEFQAFITQVKQENCIPNPEYAEAVKHGRYTGNIPANIVLVQIEKDGYSLPRGYAGRLLQLAKHFGVEYQLQDNRRQLPMVLFRSGIELRPYQAPAVKEMLRGTQGVLVSPAGSGKTETMLEVIARVGQPALWLTHTKDLAEQVMTRAKERLGLCRNEIGLIGDGAFQIGEKLTVGIIQTLCRMDLKDLAGRFGLVMVDEVHHVGGSGTWIEVVDKLPARWRYGCTASWNRADGLEVITERYIGPVLHRVERSAVELTGNVIIPELRVIKTETVSETYQKHEERLARWRQLCKEYKARNIREPRRPVLNYSGVLNDILFDPGRNQLILETLKTECTGHYSLVLSERVDHCLELKRMLDETRDTYATEVIHGKLPKSKRDKIIQAMRNGKIDILFAVDIAKEGLDIPRLDRLFLVAGGRNEAELEQKIGRIQRTFPGKRDAVVFDFVDEKIGVLRAQYWARRKVYKRLGMLRNTETRKAI